MKKFLVIGICLVCVFTGKAVFASIITDLPSPQSPETSVIFDVDNSWLRAFPETGNWILGCEWFNLGGECEPPNCSPFTLSGELGAYCGNSVFPVYFVECNPDIPDANCSADNTLAEARIDTGYIGELAYSWVAGGSSGDTDINTWGASITDTAKENIFGIISENKVLIALIMVGIITIMCIFNLIRDAIMNAKYGKDGWGDGSDV